MTKPKKAVEAPEEVEPLRIDIACGGAKAEGWTGIDIADIEGVDIVHDLNVFPWPFEDNSVDAARCSHYIEHVVDLISFMNELHRVMKPGAICEIWAPYYTSRRCWQDPTHVRAISETSFLYYNQDWVKSSNLGHYGITADFDFSYAYQINDQSWANRNEEARNFAIQHYFNIVDDLYVTLKKK